MTEYRRAVLASGLILGAYAVLALAIGVITGALG